MHVATHVCSHGMQKIWKHAKVVKQQLFPDNSNVTLNTQTAKN